jgi:hypothetical protein
MVVVVVAAVVVVVVVLKMVLKVLVGPVMHEALGEVVCAGQELSEYAKQLVRCIVRIY